jgi:WD40 repeat protein
VHSAQFSPDGKRIVTASDDKTARLRDTENSKLLATLQWIPSANLGAIHDRLAVVARDSTAGDTPRDTPYLRVLRHFVHE